MKVTIREVNSSADLNAFIKFQFKHYTGNKYWTPPIIKEEKEFLSKKNPALGHAEMQLILAFFGGKIVGRAAILINHKESESTGITHARFGWIEFINKIDVSKALFKYLEDWAKARNATLLKGPMGFTNFDKTGLLIEGFDKLGSMSTIYNHPFYPKHLDSLGFGKLADWHEYTIPVPSETPAKIASLSKAIHEKYNLQDIQIKKKKELQPLFSQFFDLMETAYGHIEGFIPFSDAQKAYYQKKFFPLIHPDMAKFIADKDGQLIAFGIAMPSFSKALRKANGNKFPKGFYFIRQALKRNDSADLYLIAVHPEWQNKGIPAIIMDAILQGLRKNNIKIAETTPELETNQQIHRLLSEYKTTPHKRRRVYSKELIVLQ